MRTIPVAVLLYAFITLAPAESGSEPHRHGGDTEGKTPLEANGNDAFGAIQEVIRKLEADPKTDWTKVNLEAFRQHLADMHNMTIHVEVLSETEIENGMRTEVRATSSASEASLGRVLAVHPVELKKETGWDMQVTKQGDLFTLVVTTRNSSETDRIRGLGYIGWMALGDHHNVHHWAMVKGGRGGQP